jgi:hypothetical protein
VIAFASSRGFEIVDIGQGRMKGNVTGGREWEVIPTVHGTSFRGFGIIT